MEHLCGMIRPAESEKRKNREREKENAKRNVCDLRGVSLSLSLCLCASSQHFREAAVLVTECWRRTSVSSFLFLFLLSHFSDHTKRNKRLSPRIGKEEEKKKESWPPILCLYKEWKWARIQGTYTWTFSQLYELARTKKLKKLRAIHKLCTSTSFILSYWALVHKLAERSGGSSLCAPNIQRMNGHTRVVRAKRQLAVLSKIKK